MMNILIVEDEALAADRLEKILKEITPEITVLAKLGSIKESVKWLMLNSADLIFLDIQLSDGLSFSIFDQVSVQTPVIFTTAYDQYAIKAFQLNSVSYLLKPIRKNDLAESLQKYKSLKSAFSIDFDSLLSVIQGNKPEYRKRFLIQIADKFRKVEVEDIAFFYASDRNVFLTTLDGHSYPMDISLDSLENVIDPALFFRINRKYIVSMKSIANMFAWSRSRIKLVLKPPTDDEMDTIVSIDRTADFKKWMNK
jgi:DNA-binding LytR/AlgR family response regulator